MKNEAFNTNLKQSKGFRVFLYLFILLICTLIGSLIALLFTSDITQMKIAQGISSTLMFIVPPIVLYYITRSEPLTALGFRKIDRWWLFAAGIALMFISLPITNKLTEWNEGMQLGERFAALEEMMKNLEDTAAALTEKMLKVDTFGGLLFNLLVIALIPAIGEELTFRGVLQQALTKKHPHLGIWISAAIFSFIHFQFYGFVPRMFLGLILGYLFYATGSLWTSIAMHFVNNGTAVVVYYLDHKGIIDAEVDSFGSTDSWWVLGLSIVVTVAVIVVGMRRKTIGH